MLVFLFFTTGPEKILTRNPNRTSSFWIKEPDETPNCLITKMILYWIGIVSMQVLLIKNAEVKLSKFSELQFNIAQNPALKHTHTHTHIHNQWSHVRSQNLRGGPDESEPGQNSNRNPSVSSQTFGSSHRLWSYKHTLTVWRGRVATHLRQEDECVHSMWNHILLF